MTTTSSPVEVLGDERDAGVVEEICGHLMGSPPRSFFLFAGAGSGKTRTLIEVLRRLTGLHADHAAGRELARRLHLRGQQIRVITYTNNAVDVIRGRLGDNPLVSVSTIHSFAWELIQGFDEDIREGLLAKNQRALEDVRARAQNRRKGPTASDERKIQEHERKSDEIRQVLHFTYSPDRRTHGVGALQHSEVLHLAASLLGAKLTLAQVLCDRHPLVLVDEAQDTNRDVIGALLAVESTQEGKLTLGLIGDFRQRIYLDGHADLPGLIPARWAKPELQMNWRSEKRIVDLINGVWAAEIPGRAQSAQGPRQHARVAKSGGTVRFFVGPTEGTLEQKLADERRCAEAMAEATGDADWASGDYKVLVLEHKLAARRAGFITLVEKLEKVVAKDRLWERGDDDDGAHGGPSELRVLMREVASFREALHDDGSVDEFAMMALLQKSHLLDGLEERSAQEQSKRLGDLADAVQRLASCFGTSEDPPLRDLVRAVVETQLFDVHEMLRDALEDPAPAAAAGACDTEGRDSEGVRELWRDVLERPWSELVQYRHYRNALLNFATHQGVKGSEFDRVLVVLDDQAAGGFLFSYDKLLGAKDLSKTDRVNEEQGKETTIDRTLRLFYVACSRASKSLAVVGWSSSPEEARRSVLAKGWFVEEEIVVLGS